MRSWRTTVLGIATIVGAGAAVAKALLDGDPATNPDWPTLYVAITVGLGLIFARDEKQHEADKSDS